MTTDNENGAGIVRRQLEALAERHSLSSGFPPEVLVEVADWVDAPGIDDPTLDDWTHRPFVTIDNHDSRDLDQALHIERREDGYEVAYALADASFYVRPGSALHSEALRRGVTHYFPGFAIPMLPAELSEGLVSLNEGVDRRALAVVTELDRDGAVKGSRFVRVRIRSRAKLTYRGVQAFLDGLSVPWADQPYAESLQLLKEVGELRIAFARERDVVRFRRDEVRVDLDPADPSGVVITARQREGVERWNEQISLLCNEEGARFMESAGNAPWVTPIYRVHPRPLAKRISEFEQLVDGVVLAHGLDPALWGWNRSEGETLAAFLAKLPEDEGSAPIAQAIHRQAIMINRASVFSAQPGEHHGIGAEPYARFSSPMREMVGVYTHKEALEKLSGAPPPGWVRANEASRAEMVEAANAARTRQKVIAKEADKIVLDRLLRKDLQQALEDRPVRSGSILGVSAKKVYVRFDAPPFEVKLYVPDLEGAAKDLPKPELRLDASGACLRPTDARLPLMRLGDTVRVRLVGLGPRGRYRFELV